MGLVDAALAAERMVCAAETLGLGICYIGALRNDAQGVAQLLNLPDGTFGAFGLCLGWPSPDAKSEIKPRLRPNTIWFKERYQAETDISEYDERMRQFYASQGMNPGVTWSMRSGKRVDDHHLTGRERLREFRLQSPMTRAFGEGQRARDGPRFAARTRTNSAAMLTAISSTDSAPISKPIGDCTASNCSFVQMPSPTISLRITSLLRLLPIMPR
ncbi:MAG: hypothetical protein C4340_03365 [Armatimonadota bacterium]